MNDEKGIIKEIKDSEVTVEFYRSSACEKCGACMMAKDTGKMMIKLPYTKKVEIGDEVYVDVKRDFFLFSSVMLYIFPLVVLVGAIVVGVNIIKGESAQVYSALIGIALSFGSYFALKLFKKKFLDMKTKSMTYYKV